ncbi:hypothetical protein DFR24_4526 [Panacagrimonas perspica]|uniref:Yip1 domain-containing protein n=1 Tax=Panacagrimonas perspica TaxID=381431 RepID=A0A4S3K9Z9_9GAMM|nr:hypothetical protein [Panacagrimonas perspica]TDU24261.1 hypothetical protein DFR24_4526 [Panacagrimonas perspica]THD04664.1 hypothetical protein B1810_04420 [Panacagrimonas perspica]
MLQSVLTATFNLLFFRAGPQDFPYDPRLTGWLLPLAALSNYFVLQLALPAILAAAIGLAMVIALSFTTRLYLRSRKLEARYMQTLHALLAVSSVLTLALALPFSEIAPQLEKFAAMNPGATEPMPELQFPAWAGFTMNLLNIWNFAVNVHIYRQSGNASLAGGVLVTMLIAFAVLMFVLFFASFVAALFGGSPTPG